MVRREERAAGYLSTTPIIEFSFTVEPHCTEQSNTRLADCQWVVCVSSHAGVARKRELPALGTEKDAGLVAKQYARIARKNCRGFLVLCRWVYMVGNLQPVEYCAWLFVSEVFMEKFMNVE